MGERGGKRRGCLQFGLRSVLLLTLLVALIIGMGRAYIDPYFAQEKALNALKNHQASVHTRYTLPKRLKFLEQIDSRGKERFREVVHLDMTYGDFAKDHIRHLLAMRRLESLVLRGEQFDESHLERVAALPDLHLVVLDATSVTLEQARKCEAEHPNLKVRLSQRSIFKDGVDRFFTTTRLAVARKPFVGQLFVLDDTATCTAARNSLELDYWQKLSDKGMDIGVEHWLDVDRMILYSPDDSAIDKVADAHSTRRLQVKRSRLSPDGIRQLGFIHQLTDLSLASPIVPPELSALGWQSSLTSLSLVNAGVTDETLPHLAAFTQLRTLDLSANEIRGPGLKHLRGLPLEQLKLNKTAVNTEGLATLAALSTLQSLEIADTPVRNAGIAALAQLPQLKNLDLRHTNIDDSVMEYLTQLVALESLSLQNTRIHGEQLIKLATLPRLRRLDLSLTKVSPERINELERRRPQLNVWR